jgi:uncharacterized protein (DUF1697 family)
VVADVVALLRSVNVGGNRMKMEWLRALAVSVGCDNVRTIVATGNIVMSPPHDLPATGRALEEGLAAHFGRIDVVMRTHEQMRSAVTRNPWGTLVESGELEGRAVNTMFCARAPTQKVIDSLPRVETDDELTVSGAEVYLKLAGSASDTRYTGAWLERHLQITGTVRNHNTVLKVLAATA